MDGGCGLWYVTFPSTFWALRAEKALLRRGFRARLRPVPRILSSSCGLALEVCETTEEDLASGLREEAIQFEGIYQLPGRRDVR